MPEKPIGCAICGSPLPPRKKGRGCGRPNLYCTLACRLSRNRIVSRMPGFVPTIACTVCGGRLPSRQTSTRGAPLKVCGVACKKERRRRFTAAESKRHRKRIYAGIKARRAANPEKHSAQAAEYRRRWISGHRERFREIVRRWRKANPELVRARNALARGNRCAGRGHCTRPQLEARIAYYGGRCWIPGCGRDGDTVDHVIPLSSGGPNWPANLRPACTRHNSGRKNIHWRIYLARLANEDCAGGGDQLRQRK